MLLIASIIVCCSLIALLENETVSLVEPGWVKPVSYTHLINDFGYFFDTVYCSDRVEMNTWYSMSHQLLSLIHI